MIKYCRDKNIICLKGCSEGEEIIDASHSEDAYDGTTAGNIVYYIIKKDRSFVQVPKFEILFVCNQFKERMAENTTLEDIHHVIQRLDSLTEEIAPMVNTIHYFIPNIVDKRIGEKASEAEKSLIEAQNMLMESIRPLAEAWTKLSFVSGVIEKHGNVDFCKK